MVVVVNSAFPFFLFERERENAGLVICYVVAIMTRGAGEGFKSIACIIISTIELKTCQRWNGIIVINGKNTLEKDNGESSGLLHECVRN